MGSELRCVFAGDLCVFPDLIDGFPLFFDCFLLFLQLKCLNPTCSDLSGELHWKSIQVANYDAFYKGSSAEMNHNFPILRLGAIFT